ncbi:hypothetical protein H9P43_001778 [Blastocladiella emersonii ATCC 22665]|nr:hypothetical protein H9P43_001778 [Blastocladiella emersonii ATCC 22665]
MATELKPTTTSTMSAPTAAVPAPAAPAAAVVAAPVPAQTPAPAEPAKAPGAATDAAAAATDAANALLTSEKDKERLAARIARRPSKADLKLRNIIRVDSSDSIALQLQRAGSAGGAAPAGGAAVVVDQPGSISERSKALKGCLKKRPERQELMDKNILKAADNPNIDSSLAQAAEQLKRAQLSDALESRLQARPTPDQLPERLLKFDESVEVLPTFRKTEYNRRPDTNSTFRKLTPKMKMEIREELNSFKRNEMPVHADSLQNTAFH